MSLLLPHQFLQQPQGRTFVNTANRLGKDISFLWNAADRANDSTNEFILNASTNGQDITTEATTRGVAMKAVAQGAYFARLNTRNTTNYTAGTLTTIRAPGTNFTFGVAFRIKTIPTASTAVMDINNPGSWYHEIGLDSGTSKVYSQVITNTKLLADNTFSAGDWAYVVAVVKSGDFHMYVNGVKQAQTTAGTDPSNSLTEVAFNPSNVSILTAFASRAVWTQGDVDAWTANPWQLFAPTRRKLFVVSVQADYYPNSDITTTGWSAVPPGSLYAAIDEATPSDSDYIVSPDLSSTPGPAVFGLNQSAPAGSYTVNVRAKYGLTAGQFRVSMLDSGGTSVGTSAWTSVTGAFATYAVSLTTTGTAVRVKIEVQ